MGDLREARYNGYIQRNLFVNLQKHRKLPLGVFLHAYVNPEIGRNVLKKMINDGVAKIDLTTQIVYYVPEKK